MQQHIGNHYYKPDYKVCLVVFLIAIAIRSFFLVFIDEPVLFFKYPFFAEKLVQGVDIKERLVDLSPFYLYLMTLLTKVFGADWSFVKFFQSFIGALNCLFLYAVGTRAFRREVGLLAALMFSVYGNVIILESTLEPTVFVLLFNLLSVYFLLLAKDGFTRQVARMRFPFVSGLFVGLSVVTKPNFLLFLPLAALWLLFFGNRALAFKKRLLSTLLFSGGVLLIVMPISIRNYMKVNDFVLVTADAGKVFHHGNGRGATALEGTGLPNEGFMQESGVEPDYAHVLYRQTASRLSGRKLSPSESSMFWIKQTLDDIGSDIVGYITLEAKKLFYFFNDYEMHYIASAYKEYKTSLAYPFIRYGIITSFSLLGLALALRYFKEHFFIYSVVFVYLISGMLFLVQSRYRTPAVPYLCLFAGYGIHTLRELFVTRRLKLAGLALVLVGIIFYLVYFGFRGEIADVDRWQQATKIHYEMGGRRLFEEGKYRKAISELETSVAMVPTFAPAYNLLGRSYAALGKYDEAVPNLKKVIELAPEVPEGYKNLGFVYMVTGDRAKARRFLSRALSINPEDDEVRRTIMRLDIPND